ncbi:DNA polymerase III subunit gamma/tau [Paraliomyxa miuraensis]|uniref:DNA polymerase III subunit gamma/tau n=1 Tax=Paraliomyxa miuraensis TaxID=376150 RepID=UPI00225A0234|nr:DNA polymerase III subunit gamma/tau [Paraliomyxa miuraensis]MCX4240585.1 DNA polymerase III subunit gamma/tau [Paraliomyxa miuraensis]
MSYVVLARKYRPMRFSDMVGQEHIGRTLGNAIKQDRVHHAYLFSGARGLGKTTTARIFAKGLVCVNGPTAEPCNECSECVAISEGRSVDVMEIDGASNNSVDDIRNLREQVNYLPQTARRKVYIIDEVHMLSTSAFNALLKTLEEPPPHVSFVFATTEPQKVLPTILSRVNRLDFKRVAPGELVVYLRSILEREGLSVEEGGLRIVARAGEGSVRDSLTLLDQVIAFAEDSKLVTEEEVRRLLGQADASALLELVDAVLDGDPTTTMKRLDALVTAGNDLTVLSLQVLELLRDLTVLAVCGTSEVLPDATEAELAQLRALGSKVEPSHLGQLFDRFSRVIDRLPQSRTQRLLVEMGLLELACAEPVIPLGDLVDQLHALGRGAPPSSSRGGSAPRAPGGGTGTAGPPRGSGGGGRRAQADERPGFMPPEPPPFEDVPPWLDEAPPSRPMAAEPPPRPDAPRAMNEPPHRAMNEPPHRAVNEPSHRAMNEPPHRAMNEPPHRAMNEPPHRAMNEPPHRAVNEPPHRAMNEPPHRAVNEPPRAMNEPPHREPDRPRAAPTAPDPEVSPFMAKWLDKGRSEGIVIDEEPIPSDRRPPSTPPVAGPSSSTPRPKPKSGSPGSSGQPVQTSPAPEQDSVRMGVGPCLPPPPADGVIPWEELPAIEAWEQLVSRIAEEDDFLAAVLSQVGLSRLEGGVLCVAAPRGDFSHTELARNAQRRAQIEQATRDHLGAPFTLELVEGRPELPDLPSLALVVEQRRKEHRAAVEAEAKAHPAIRALLQTFDAQLLGTKPLHEP